MVSLTLNYNDYFLSTNNECRMTDTNIADSRSITPPVSSPQSSDSDVALTETLLPADVVCGKDKLSRNNPGNKKFRNIVEMHREEYQNAASRDVKTAISNKIVSLINNSGGRFLKLENGEFIAVSNQYAREKVSHALRSAKDRSQPRPKKSRKVKVYTPTAAEDILFMETLRDQQRIFKNLVATGGGQQGMEPDDINFEDIELLLTDR